MPYIKELIIHGFKSFARETKIPFRNTMNVVVGPNGSGKSNITDAICFVLGRLGSKSMRAKRLSNLIFAGTNKYKPSKEASVEMVFDNSDKEFSLNEETIKIKRILRRNGQGIYKINDEIKTRQEVLELLAQAGIDPNGFNIVLQGEIDSFVKMPPDKRKQIVEEVAGISIYELRKEKSLKELDKTEQKLKEVSATLRERQAYLRNLEEERKQALKFQKLQQDVKNYKASILHKIISEKKEKIEEVNKEIEKQQREIQKTNELIDKSNEQINMLNEKINHITNKIQKDSGIEQEKLYSEISDIRAEIAGLTIKKQSLETQINETEKRKQSIEENIEILDKEISNMSKAKTKINLKTELELKKSKLEEIDEKRRKLYIQKSNLSSINSRIDDKKRSLYKINSDYDFVLERIKETEALISIKETIEQHNEKIAKLKSHFERLKSEIKESDVIKFEKEKERAINESKNKELDKTIEKIASLDICPLCKTKMTKEHVSKVFEEIKKQKEENSKIIENANKLIKESLEKAENFSKECQTSEHELKTRTQDLLRLELINEKKDHLRTLSEEKRNLENEISDLEKKKKDFEENIAVLRTSEENYDSLRLELQELERRQEKDVGMDITIKQRDIERTKNILKQAIRELEEAREEFLEINEHLEEKQDILEEKNEEEDELKRKFNKILSEKNECQEKIRFFERDILHKQTDKHLIEEKINNLKIDRAQISAQKEASEQEAEEFKGAVILRMSLEELRINLDKTQQIINTLGTVNLRALEIYEDFKKQYDEIQQKAEVLLKEKEEILKVIEDIDKKKKRVFTETLTKINELFSRNFSQLSTKGIASLEPVDEENLLESGLEMLIKVGKGKYFDTHSLSGGEQSLISLALIFAIQEYKPYCFYIFDEIDAALDRRNSERLAMLLKKYMKSGQYLIVTHNDSLITESPIIYGVTMQDKISNVLSLEV